MYASRISPEIPCAIIPFPAGIFGSSSFLFLLVSFFETIREQALADDSLVAAATPYSKQSRDLTIIENVGLAQDNYLFTPETSELVFSLEPNDLSEVLEDSTRLFIVEVISETLGEYATLEEFLEQEKSTKVQIL